MFYLNFVRLCNGIAKSPSAVAEEMGFQRSVVTRWRKGSVPRKATIEKIADYFGVPAEELTGEDQKEKPSTPEDAEREAHGQAILDKYNMLDPATQAMFESMLDAAIAAQEKKNG